MNIEEIFKVLANPLRIKILQWLKDPEDHFAEMVHLPLCERGKGYVCVGTIKEKADIAQSTISHYLKMLSDVKLLSSKRIGKWTYYRRNEENIALLIKYLDKEL